MEMRKKMTRRYKEHPGHKADVRKKKAQKKRRENDASILDSDLS